ncbi:243_t:CDS:1, partial [Gigaspora rosea]
LVALHRLARINVEGMFLLIILPINLGELEDVPPSNTPNKK